MIVWCQKCEAVPIEVTPLCVSGTCWECVDPQRYILGPYESPEYFAPRESFESFFDLMAVFNMLFPPKSDDHIIRSEN